MHQKLGLITKTLTADLNASAQQKQMPRLLRVVRGPILLLQKKHSPRRRYSSIRRKRVDLAADSGRHFSDEFISICQSVIQAMILIPLRTGLFFSFLCLGLGTYFLYQ